MMIINLLGLVLIGLIIWWFWLYKPAKAVDSSKENITIIVNNGIYEPSRIKTVSGKKTSLIFLRKDGSPCASTVLFPDFEISEELPLDSNKTVDLPSMPPGGVLVSLPDEDV
jgi:plastocyanin domain-containing protein